MRCPRIVARRLPPTWRCAEGSLHQWRLPVAYGNALALRHTQALISPINMIALVGAPVGAPRRWGRAVQSPRPVLARMGTAFACRPAALMLRWLPPPNSARV